MGGLEFIQRVNDSCNIVIVFYMSVGLGMSVWEGKLLLSG